MPVTEPRLHPVVRAALYLYVGSLPFEVPERGSVPIEVHTGTGVLLLAAALLQPRVMFAAPPQAFWWFSLYFFVLVVLGTVTHHVGQWLKDIVTFFQVLLLFWTTSVVMRVPREATRVMAVFACACCVLAVLQVLGITTSVAEVGAVAVRMTALGQNPNTLAHNMSVALLILVGLGYRSGRAPVGLRPLIWSGCVLLGLTIMPTASRGALLALLAGLAALVVVRTLTAPQARTIVAAGVLLLGLTVAAYRSDPMRDRLVSSAETSDMAQRENLFPAAWAMFLDKPLLGWGPVNNRFELERLVPRIELPFRESHNMTLELLTEVGLVGGVPFLIGVLLCLRGAWHALKGPHGALPMALMLSLLVMKMGTAGIATKMHWLILAIAVASTRERRLETRVPSLVTPTRNPPRAAGVAGLRAV